MKEKNKSMSEDIRQESTERLREQQKKARAKYDKNNTKHYGFKLNKNTDSDIIGYLEGVDNKNLYIKTLIREDMERNGITKREDGM